MNKTDNGSNIEYSRLSYRGRFFRNLWMTPLALIFLLFPNDLFKFLVDFSGISIISKTSVTLFMVFVFLSAATYNLYMWKSKKA